MEAVCLEQQYAAVDSLVLASLAQVYCAIGKMQESGFVLSPSKDVPSAQGSSQASTEGANTSGVSDPVVATQQSTTAGRTEARVPVTGRAAPARNALDLSYINPVDELPQSLHRFLTPRMRRLLHPWW